MSAEQGISTAGLIELTADVVAAFVSHNPLPVAGLPDLISSIHSSLEGLVTQSEAPSETLKPAVNPKKSILPDYIISLEDGRRFKSIKRHLRMLGMTPEQYRDRWNLPRDYPMVAPNYSATRSQLARSLGLGRKAAAPEEPVKKTRAKRKLNA
jgi:predicted transcriptional regulator